MIWLLFIIVCVVGYCIGGSEVQMSFGVSNEHLLNCCVYPFAHASWLHLGVNMLSLGLMFGPICGLWRRKYHDTIYTYTKLFAYSYVAAVLASVVCATDVPTVGASGMVFFLLGVLLMLNPTLKQLKAYIWVAAAVIIQIYFGKSNTALHLVSFAEGALLVIAKEAIRKLNEYRGVHSNQ